MREQVPGVIGNPVLAGSHPDPSIVRVGSDYYLATSTFEWAPGVRLHHSTDLVHWRPLGGALDGPRLLDLTGCPDSGGVWAPALSHADGLFHLVYSNVSTYAGGFTDSPNLLVTAPAPHGPWSDPVPLHARGFDASLFHDGGESLLLNMVHDWRPGHGGSTGLEITRYDRTRRALTGEPRRIVLPAQDAWVEGPNLYRRGPWYYLLTADGGTGYGHRVTVARSRSVTGPYERDPAGPLVTSAGRPDHPLQKAGHGSLVETADGRWYMAYLVARPLGRHGPCVLGRETALTPVAWTPDGWPRTPTGLPELRVPAPGPAAAPRPPEHGRAADSTDDGPTRSDDTDAADSTDSTDGTDDFDAAELGPDWSTLRRHPSADWLSLTERPSHLRLRGGRSPRSLTGPSLVARRLTSHRCSFEATVEYRPRSFQHLAGITAYYNTLTWYFLHVTADDDGRPVLRAAGSDRGVVTLDEAGQVPLGDTARLRLGFDVDGPRLRFRYDAGTGWRPLGGALDATVLSDEHAEDVEDGLIRGLGFTGAFAGLWTWDLTGGGLPADFDEATYRETA